jgi:hypothetical protein
VLIILKLDFEKTFNKIESKAFNMGPSYKFCRPKDLVTNGSLGSKNCSALEPHLSSSADSHERLRQELDKVTPLVPLAFCLLVEDLLQTIFNRAKDLNLLKHPLPLKWSNGFPIIQYVDDSLIVMEACSRQLVDLKGLLSFGESIGLKVNYSKSVMVPII